MEKLDFFLWTRAFCAKWTTTEQYVFIIIIIIMRVFGGTKMDWKCCQKVFEHFGIDRRTCIYLHQMFRRAREFRCANGWQSDVIVYTHIAISCVVLAARFRSIEFSYISFPPLAPVPSPNSLHFVPILITMANINKAHTHTSSAPIELMWARMPSAHAKQRKSSIPFNQKDAVYVPNLFGKWESCFTNWERVGLPPISVVWFLVRAAYFGALRKLSTVISTAPSEFHLIFNVLCASIPPHYEDECSRRLTHTLANTVCRNLARCERITLCICVGATASAHKHIFISSLSLSSSLSVSLVSLCGVWLAPYFPFCRLHLWSTIFGCNASARYRWLLFARSFARLFVCALISLCLWLFAEVVLWCAMLASSIRCGASDQRWESA